jgi:hypothetical protein
MPSNAVCVVSNLAVSPKAASTVLAIPAAANAPAMMPAMRPRWPMKDPINDDPASSPADDPAAPIPGPIRLDRCPENPRAEGMIET